jgi:tRNA-2-methylthio-N6-dimethylallyladenosine synthase
LVEGPSKRSEEQFCGRNGQNCMVIFPKGDLKKGDYIMVKITDCTSATLFGDVLEKCAPNN